MTNFQTIKTLYENFKTRFSFDDSDLKKIAIIGMPVAAGLSIATSKVVSPWLQKAREENRIANIEKLKTLKKIAKSRGGKCLSGEYVNAFTKLSWKCSKGHIWDDTPNNIKKGKWCKNCSKTKRLTIGEMQQIAESRGGKCLSKKYVNSFTKLEWKCKNGHKWMANPESVKRGSWCRKCHNQSLIGRKRSPYK